MGAISLGENLDIEIKSRGAGKRLTEDRKAAETGEMTQDQFEFIMAIEDYKKTRKQTYVSSTQILEIALFLGYRKVSDKGDYRLDRDKGNNLQSGKKLCNLCKQTLPLTDFNSNDKSGDGTEGICQTCKKFKNQLKSSKRTNKNSQNIEEGELSVLPD